MAVSQHFIAWTCDENSKLDNWFLYYWMQSKKQLFERMAVGSTIKTIGLPFFKKLKITLPPLPEQRKIADILSTWDRAIDTSEALLATARSQKRALMQSLLTGKRRFREFEGQEWREVRLGDVVQISKKRHNPKNGGASHRCVEMEHIEAETGRLIGWTNSDQQASIKAVFGPDDVLFGKLRPYLRKFWAPDFDGVCSTEIWVLQTKSPAILPRYLYCLIQSDGFMTEAEKSAGSKMPRADWKVVSEYCFKLPTPSEQQKIAVVFHNCEQEVFGLVAQIEKLRTEKKALMQQLLAGKLRVKVEVPDAV